MLNGATYNRIQDDRQRLEQVAIKEFNDFIEGLQTKQILLVCAGCS